MLTAFEVLLRQGLPIVGDAVILLRQGSPVVLRTDRVRHTTDPLKVL